MGVSFNALSHGYIIEKGMPTDKTEFVGLEGAVASRAKLCSSESPSTGVQNTQCTDGPQYEPQSIEGPEGFPEQGAKDGKIASAELVAFSHLDQQTSDKWAKTPVQAGPIKLEWYFTANHKTRDFRYYITKANWNPNKPLSRDAFDLNPFCEIDGGMSQPDIQTIHDCTLPEREGYHVILAYWDVGDTTAAFYNVLDVQFDGDTPPNPEWNQSGYINPIQDLEVGDTVYTRVFDENGELPSYSTSLTIDKPVMGQANVWSYLLANKVNSEQSQVKAGKLEEDEFKPTYGPNPIYLKSDSDLTNVEIGYDIQSPEPDYSLSVEGLDDEYVISNTPVTLDLSLISEGDITAELTVYNHGQEQLAHWTEELQDGVPVGVQLQLSESVKGHHMLVYILKNKDGHVVDQDTLDFHLIEESTPPLPGDYDFIFPESLSSYTEGTKVLARDGLIYQCKPFPYSGFCQQWNEGSTAFEPGIGSDWQQAWTKVN